MPLTFADQPGSIQQQRMPALSDFTPAALEAALLHHGFPPVHARAILRTYYAGWGEFDYGAIRIGKSLQRWLRQNVGMLQSRVLRRHESADGTIKLLVGFDGGGAVESVLMPSHRADRAAVCLSSQIGCAMGCDFCASTQGGVERNLGAGEIVEQFLHAARQAAQSGRRIASVVFMGMGEPMLNLGAVIPALWRIAEPPLGNLGYRAITVSTVGIVPGIDALAEANLGVHLALSLHAPDDPTRSRLVPANHRWKVHDILEAARRFQQRSGRPVNIEYCLLAGVNDSDDQARLLAELLQGWRVHVNLIPYNSIGAGISGRIYQRPSPQRIDRFTELLRQARVVTHVRQTRGDDVAAACGQLRRLVSPARAGEGDSIE